MLAPPGGGKGTQGVRLAHELGVPHISSGDVLRAAVAEDTELGREVKAHMAAGRLAPDELVTRAITPVQPVARDPHSVLGVGAHQ